MFATAAAGDPVARAIIDRLADELATMAIALARRARPRPARTRRSCSPAASSGPTTPGFHDRLRATDRTPRSRRPGSSGSASPPVVGAALIGLDRLAGGSADPAAEAGPAPALDDWNATPHGCHAVVAPVAGRSSACITAPGWHPSATTPRSRSSHVYDAPRPERDARRTAAARTSPSAAGWIALAIWALFAILAVLGCRRRRQRVLAVHLGSDRPTRRPQGPVVQRAVGHLRPDRQVELARFGGEKREVVEFEDIPPIVLDAQTAVEDKTFWDNAGFDPLAIVSAGIDSLRGNSRGASTITQQLVRQRLLDPALVQDPNRTLERKLKEIIQSIRLTEAYPGVEGKQQIIAAYLNQNYYGNQTYGVKAAAETYFGIDAWPRSTPAQAAILAGLAKSPSNYDLVRNAEPDCTDRIADDPRQVPNERAPSDRPRQTDDRPAPEPDPRPARRGPDGPMSGDQYSPAEFEAAKRTSRSSSRRRPPRAGSRRTSCGPSGRARRQAVRPGVPTCDRLAAGGLTITTTLDTKVQTIAEKWVQAAAPIVAATTRTRRPRWQGARSCRAAFRSGSRTCAARTSTTARSSRSTTRPAS